eukprot:9019104-Karenia_brevis.AAC.1
MHFSRLRNQSLKHELQQQEDVIRRGGRRGGRDRALCKTSRLHTILKLWAPVHRAKLVTGVIDPDSLKLYENPEDMPPEADWDWSGLRPVES